MWDEDVAKEEQKQLSHWLWQVQSRGIRVIQLTLPRRCRGWYMNWAWPYLGEVPSFCGIPVRFREAQK